MRNTNKLVSISSTFALQRRTNLKSLKIIQTVSSQSKRPSFLKKF